MRFRVVVSLFGVLLFAACSDTTSVTPKPDADQGDTVELPDIVPEDTDQTELPEDVPDESESCVESCIDGVLTRCEPETLQPITHNCALACDDNPEAEPACACASLDDCQEQEYCDEEGRCAPQLCEPGSRVCDADAALVCASDGGSLERIECAAGCSNGACLCTQDADCAAAEHCVEGTGCVSDLCAQGALYCDDAQLMQCDERGAGASLVEDCGAPGCFEGACGCADNQACSESQHCAPGVGPEGQSLCQDDICEAGTRYCDEAQLMLCDSSGASAAVLQTCAAQCVAEGGLAWCACTSTDDCGNGEYCDPSGHCVGSVCVPSSLSCDGNTAVTCSADGSQEQRVDCGAMSCDGGRCLCTAHSQCAAAEYCDQATGECVADLCVQGSESCSGLERVLCNEHGNAFSPLETCLLGCAVSGVESYCRCNNTAHCPLEQFCNPQGRCAEDVCIAGDMSCDGNTAVACSADGGEAVRTNCGAQVCSAGLCTCTQDSQCAPEEYCSAASLCVGDLCVASQRICMGDAAMLCDERGASLQEVQRCEPGQCAGGDCVCLDVADCGLNESCDAGVCTCPSGPHCGLESYCCPGGTVCEDEVCKVLCTTDSDCQGDTYCCTSGCGAHSICVPYGTGPRGDIDPLCRIDIVVGQMEARTQCEWVGPPPGDPYPNHVQVLTTVMVADLPHDSGAAAEIVLVSYNYTDGGNQAALGNDARYYGVIRVLNGQTCEQLESIDDPSNRVIASSPPALADLDGDGFVDIVTQRAISGMIAFRWDAAAGHYVTYWVSTGTSIVNAQRWDGPAVHDLNDDGVPEVISGGEVYNGQTGARLNTGQSIPGAGAGAISVIADVDVDGVPELIAQGVWEWDSATNRWSLEHTGSPSRRHYGYADFGTPGSTAANFDPTTLDGIAEIVNTGNNGVWIYTLSGQQVLAATGVAGGGPPTIGDFDADGFPEVGVAGGTNYRIYDFDCASGGPGCLGTYLRWSQTSQDSSSSTTGSSIFDFEADGKAEAVYADECFTRIYDGETGEVLFSSFRTSCTWYENAVVADPDKDSNTEILISSNSNCSVSCPSIDPIHRGITCADPTGCLSGVCDAGYCRCTADAECDAGYRCTAPLTGTPGSGNTCRAYHPPGVGLTGVRVLRDRLDRWASSRSMWNQHPYAVTNINDDGSVPATSAWTQNFTVPELNNFRQNTQGLTSAAEVPDITGRFDEVQVCEVVGSDYEFFGYVCNRGARAVGAAMPATFYLGDPADGNILCVSYTAGPVPVGGCMRVSCLVENSVDGIVTMVVNEDGAGNATTVECKTDNNTDMVSVRDCLVN
jgi:hypothetical protein